MDADEASSVQVILRLSDGNIVSGNCNEPCGGSEAMLTFQVDQLEPSAIATSLDLADGAQIYDSENLPLALDFESVTLGQIATVTEIETIPLEMPGLNYPFWAVNVYFSDMVWKDGSNIRLRTSSGLEMPCNQCPYGLPGSQGDLIEFNWPFDDLSAAPEVPDDDQIIEIVIDGNLLTMTGLLADTTFDPVPFRR